MHRFPYQCQRWRRDLQWEVHKAWEGERGSQRWSCEEHDRVLLRGREEAQSSRHSDASKCCRLCRRGPRGNPRRAGRLAGGCFEWFPATKWQISGPPPGVPSCAAIATSRQPGALWQPFLEGHAPAAAWQPPLPRTAPSAAAPAAQRPPWVTQRAPQGPGARKSGAIGHLRTQGWSTRAIAVGPAPSLAWGSRWRLYARPALKRAELYLSLTSTDAQLMVIFVRGGRDSHPHRLT